MHHVNSKHFVQKINVNVTALGVSHWMLKKTPITGCLVIVDPDG